MDLLQHNLPTKHHIPLPKPHHQSAGLLSHPKTSKAPLLQKCGYNCNSPTTVIYSLQAHGGIGLHPLYVEYSISCIKAFMISLQSTGTLSQLAWIALAWAQHVAGTSIPILEDTSTKLPHLAPMQWIPNLHKILNNNSTAITTHNTYCINPQQCHDRHLMDLGLQLLTKPTDAQILNTCQLHLQVTLHR